MLATVVTVSSHHPSSGSLSAHNIRNCPTNLLAHAQRTNVKNRSNCMDKIALSVELSIVLESTSYFHRAMNISVPKLKSSEFASITSDFDQLCFAMMRKNLREVIAQMCFSFIRIYYLHTVSARDRLSLEIIFGRFDSSSSVVLLSNPGFGSWGQMICHCWRCPFH